MLFARALEHDGDREWGASSPASLGAVEPVLDEIRLAAAEHPLLAAVVAETEEMLLAPEDTVRYLVTGIALAAQAALLVEHDRSWSLTASSAPDSARAGPGCGTLRRVDFQAVIDHARLS